MTPRRTDLYTSFKKAVLHEEERYRHAIRAEGCYSDNPYWFVLARRIINELTDWAITRNASRRLAFDPERIKFIHREIDYGYQLGVGVSTNFLPMPDNEWEWESYELFLASIIDDERRSKDEALGREIALKRQWYPVSKLLKRIGVRWCSHCEKWTWLHRDEYDRVMGFTND